MIWAFFEHSDILRLHKPVTDWLETLPHSSDKSSLLKSQGSLYLEFIPKDGLFHKMLLLSLMGFLTGWCNLTTTSAKSHKRQY